MDHKRCGRVLQPVLHRHLPLSHEVRALPPGRARLQVQGRVDQHGHQLHEVNGKFWLNQTPRLLFRFGETDLTYDDSARNTILDYIVGVKVLDQEDRIVQYAGTNYSVTGKQHHG